LTGEPASAFPVERARAIFEGAAPSAPLPWAQRFDPPVEGCPGPAPRASAGCQGVAEEPQERCQAQTITKVARSHRIRSPRASFPRRCSGTGSSRARRGWWCVGFAPGRGTACVSIPITGVCSTGDQACPEQARAGAPVRRHPVHFLDADHAVGGHREARLPAQGHDIGVLGIEVVFGLGLECHGQGSGCSTAG